jgi:hypothetical protein
VGEVTYLHNAGDAFTGATLPILVGLAINILACWVIVYVSWNRP